jgi:hypothetical protein
MSLCWPARKATLRYVVVKVRARKPAAQNSFVDSLRVVLIDSQGQPLLQMRRRLLATETVIDAFSPLEDKKLFTVKGSFFKKGATVKTVFVNAVDGRKQALVLRGDYLPMFFWDRQPLHWDLLKDPQLRGYRGNSGTRVN